MSDFRSESRHKKLMDEEEYVADIEFGKNDYLQEQDVYQGLFWILDKRSHAINLRSIAFDDEDNTATITLSNGVISRINYHNNMELIRGIIKIMEEATK